MYRMGWTDERMDDFRDDIERRFDCVDKRFDSVNQRLDRLDGRFDALQRTLLMTSGGIIVALIGLIATQL